MAGNFIKEFSVQYNKEFSNSPEMEWAIWRPEFLFMTGFKKDLEINSRAVRR